MGEDDVSEMDRKKMEVRARLEQQSQAKKKKGFMTPERKKKLRVKSFSIAYSKKVNASLFFTSSSLLLASSRNLVFTF